MNRSGYTDDGDDRWGMIRWRGAVRSAIRGQRGQAMLRELVAALDALPEKRLAAESLVPNDDGDCCALGVLGRSRRLDLTDIDPESRHAVARTFGVAEALAAEVMEENDAVIEDEQWADVEIFGPMRAYERHARYVRVPNPRAAERRWQHMRAWAVAQIKPAL